jgi:hypothetical protein
MSDRRRERRQVAVPAGSPVKQAQRNRAVPEPVLELVVEWERVRLIEKP